VAAQMLQDAVAAARTEGSDEAAPEEWNPQITLVTSVLIPEAYVADLSVRLGLYRRIVALDDGAKSTPSPPS
jgi:transcription-repair coupling factor (superfamily II helicase)